MTYRRILPERSMKFYIDDELVNIHSIASDHETSTLVTVELDQRVPFVFDKHYDLRLEIYINHLEEFDTLDKVAKFGGEMIYWDAEVVKFKISEILWSIY